MLRAFCQLLVILPDIILPLLIVGCGGGSSLTPPSGVISVSLNPLSVAVSTGQSAQFTATVTGTTNTAINWSVNGIPGGNASVGTISAEGLYSAPGSPTSQVDTIRATSVQDSSKLATATVTVLTTGQVLSTNNPQVAQYSITSPRDATVAIQFGPDTNYGLQTWALSTPLGGGQVSILVAGMRAFTTYHLRAVAQFSDNTRFIDSDHAFVTGGLSPDRVPKVTVNRPSALSPNGGVEALDVPFAAGSSSGNVMLSGPVQAAVVDLQGNLIWYYDSPAAATGSLQPIKFLKDGDVLVNYAQGPYDGSSSVTSEISLAGNTVWQITASGLSQKLMAAGFNLPVTGVHHDIAILPNGHLILIIGLLKDFTDLPGFPGTTTVVGDGLVDLDANRNPVWAWSTFDHLDVNRHPMSFPDWTHANAVLYSPSDGNLIFSMRHQNWIIKIDYEDGRGDGHIVWKLGYQGDFTLQGGTDPIDWFYAQHAPTLLDAETSGIFKMAVFDNGNDRIVDSSGTLCGSAGAIACYSRVPVLEIDEASKTAQIIWQDPLRPLFSFFGGYVEEFSNQNIEFDAASSSPSTALIEEVTQDPTPQVVLQMTVNGQYAYRAFRIPSLYPGVQW